MKLIMKFIIELVFLYWFSMDFYKYFKLDNKILSIIFLLATIFECIYLYNFYNKHFTKD